MWCGERETKSTLTLRARLLTPPPLSLYCPSQSAKRKALDVLHGLGLSDSLLRAIERRQKLDAWLAYGGMAVVGGVLLWAWWAFKR